MSRNWPFCEQADERRYLANPSCLWLARQHRVENVSIWANLLSVGWAKAFRVNLTFNNNYPFEWPRPNRLLSQKSLFLCVLPNPLTFVLEIGGKKKKMRRYRLCVCKHSKVYGCVFLYVYTLYIYIYIKYLYNTTRDTWGSPPGNSSWVS